MYHSVTHLCKISGQAQLRVHSLSCNHILQSLLESRPSNDFTQHPLSLNSLTYRQRENIKGSIVDMNNRFNKVFPSFDPLNIEFSPSSRLIDVFPSRFSFHPFIKCKDNSLEDHSHQLNDIAIMSLLNYSYVLVISDAGIKNNVVTSITYIHVHDRPIVKTLHHTANVTSTEAELFAIRYGINQAVSLPEISKIIVVTDSIHIARMIFNLPIHLFQVHSAAISKELRKFFIANNNNSIEFWKCPSYCGWPLFKSVDRDTKCFHQALLFPCKSSWDFSKKSECDDIIQNWKMTFQASDQKGW